MNQSPQLGAHAMGLDEFLRTHIHHYSVTQNPPRSAYVHTSADFPQAPWLCLFQNVMQLESYSREPEEWLLSVNVFKIFVS